MRMDINDMNDMNVINVINVKIKAAAGDWTI